MRTVITLIAGFILFASPALADNWQAVKLRGQVLQLVDGAWQPLHRGDIVPDDRVVRTLHMGAVQFVRGRELIDLGPDTQAQILDQGGAKPFTTVRAAFGSVSVDAEVRNVQHFEVDTPMLTAVVKGTHFTVVSGKRGASVSVQRGHVEVDDHLTGTSLVVAAGQTAAIDLRKGRGLIVSGKPSGAKPVNGKVSAEKLAELKAAAKAAEEQAAILKTPEAIAAANAAEAALVEVQTSATTAPLSAKEAKAAEEAAKKAAEAEKKAAEQANKEAEEAAKKAAEEAKKAAELTNKVPKV